MRFAQNTPYLFKQISLIKFIIRIFDDSELKCQNSNYLYFKQNEFIGNLRCLERQSLKHSNDIKFVY